MVEILTSLIERVEIAIKIAEDTGEDYTAAKLAEVQSDLIGLRMLLVMSG